MVSASVGSALEAIWENRLRSLLTMLGIFIGVGAVIAALTLTQGASAYVTSRIESLGSTPLSSTLAHLIIEERPRAPAPSRRSRSTMSSP